ncbi:MAG: transcriptional regulator, AraC family [Chthoniobacteraceae bacterium]|nr:transcriptional regulator, AraC family [Chthoniobacteraceae bacterium]
MENKADQFFQERLANSQIFKEYKSAFGEATGMPLTLSPVQQWRLAHHGQRHENPFCALLASENKACAACLCVQHQVASQGNANAQTNICFAGLSETAVPIRVGTRIIGFLRTGEVLLQKPGPPQFARVAKQLREWGLQGKLEEFKTAFFQSRALSPNQYESIVQLLRIFAEHLSLIASQIALQCEASEAPNLTRAREYIEQHKAEYLSLKQVAAAVNMSSFYFCKKFHQSVGCTFTKYLARVRVEAAKGTLLKPHARVSEVAFNAGFQSITHFNRVFKNLVGQAPTEYRAGVRKAA